MERQEAERRTVEEIEARVALEQKAAKAARSREAAELLANEAANQKLQAEEEKIEALRLRAELDQQLTAAEREELNRINAGVETVQLITKLRKTKIVNKVSQFALAASLVLTLGLLVAGGSSVATASSGTPVVVAQNTSATPVEAETERAPVILASLKMATELGNYSAAKTAKN